MLLYFVRTYVLQYYWKWEIGMHREEIWAIGKQDEWLMRQVYITYDIMMWMLYVGKGRGVAGCRYK